MTKSERAASELSKAKAEREERAERNAVIRERNEKIRAAREAMKVPPAKKTPVPSSPLKKIEPLASARKKTDATFGTDLDDQAFYAAILKTAKGDKELASTLFTMARPGVPVPVKRGRGRPRKVPMAEGSSVSVKASAESYETLTFRLAAEGWRASEGFEGADYLRAVRKGRKIAEENGRDLLEYESDIINAARVMNGEPAFLPKKAADRARAFWEATEPKKSVA